MAATTPEIPARPMRDLKTRLISGLLLAAAAIGLTWYSPWTFGALVLAVSIIVAWEWGRIVRDGGVDMVFAVQAGVLIGAVVLGVLGQPIFGLIALLVGTIVTGLLCFGDRGQMSAVGVLYAGLPAVALVWFRGARPLGFEAALFVLLSVWATDTGAYAAGRLIGGPKLAPSISPNKTWSGLIGGVSASAVIALGLALIVGLASPLRLVAVAMGLAVISQAGDLMESALKRQHAVKDASNIIPGHGGFMDRVDGLIFAAVAAALVAAAINVASPAAALLGAL